MTSEEIKKYISVRNGELSSDEIIAVVNVSDNPSINHIIYENDRYQMWDRDGNYFTFIKRLWS